jgi:hypothetical protein
MTLDQRASSRGPETWLDSRSLILGLVSVVELRFRRAAGVNVRTKRPFLGLSVVAAYVRTVGRPFGGGVDAGVFQDLPDGGGGDLDAEDEQLAVHPPVAPAGVPPGQAQYQQADGPDGTGPAGPLGPGHGRVPAGEQRAVPVQDGVGPDQQPQLAKHGPRQSVEERRQQRPLGRLKPGFPVSELALQHGDLMAKGKDFDVLVVVADR